jgi:hypothetical protein
MSDLNTALARVDSFETSGSSQVRWKLDRAQTLQRIRELLRHPQQLHQRGLNACGPAAFFRIWLARDPIAAADFACALLRDGSAAVGSLTVTASQTLREIDYANLRATTDAAHPRATPEGADWMLMSALRDSENVFFDYEGRPFTVGDKLAGLTLPGTLAGWLNATNRYASVTNETSVVAAGNRPRLLSLIPTSNVDIVWLVNSSFNAHFYPTQPATPPTVFAGLHIPDHYVVMTAPCGQSGDGAWTNIDVWTWARTYSGWVGTEDFFSRYFGLILATAR